MPGLQYYQRFAAVLLNASRMRVPIRWGDRDIEVGSLGEAPPTLFIAILAGLFSFLSPCVLPLVPAYVFYLTGRTFSKTSAD